MPHEVSLDINIDFHVGESLFLKKVFQFISHVLTFIPLNAYDDYTQLINICIFYGLVLLIFILV